MLSPTLFDLSPYDQPRPLKPLLKWAGGKRWLVPYLRDYWRLHSHRRLVEPFAGGLAVTLALGPARAVVNDANPHLMNFYRSVADGHDLALAGADMDASEAGYDFRRRVFNGLVAQGRAECIEGARLFWYLNKTCFNGLVRFNRDGQFNSPWGGDRALIAPDLRPYREAFARYEFYDGDFERLPVRRDDLIFADPPYDCDFTTYSPDGFTWDDQVRCAASQSAHPGPVVASNADTWRIRAIYRARGFAITELHGRDHAPSSPRVINSSFAGRRSPLQEMVRGDCAGRGAQMRYVIGDMRILPPSLLAAARGLRPLRGLRGRIEHSCSRPVWHGLAQRGYSRPEAGILGKGLQEEIWEESHGY